MDLRIECEQVTSNANSTRSISLEIEGANEKEILDHFDLQTVVDHFDETEILDHIGLDRIKEYFNLIDNN